MSSAAKKLEKNVENQKRMEVYEAENSLAGSAILTIAKLVGKTFEESIEDYKKLKEDFPVVNNVKELCDYLIDFYKMKDEYKEGLVLIFDENNVYTPVVTAMVEASTGPIYLPISKSGIYPAIMRNINEDNIIVEQIYEGDENEENK